MKKWITYNGMNIIRTTNVNTVTHLFDVIFKESKSQNKYILSEVFKIFKNHTLLLQQKVVFNNKIQSQEFTLLSLFTLPTLLNMVDGVYFISKLKKLHYLFKKKGCFNWPRLQNPSFPSKPIT